MSLDATRVYFFEKMIQNVGYNHHVFKEIEYSVVRYTKQQSKQKYNITSAFKKWSQDLRVRRLYIRKSRMILNNIVDILQMIQNDQVKPEHVAFVRHQDIKPDMWTPLIQKSNKRHESTLTCDYNTITNTSPCPSCGNIDNVQVMKVHSLCLDCEYKWNSSSSQPVSQSLYI